MPPGIGPSSRQRSFLHPHPSFGVPSVSSASQAIAPDEIGRLERLAAHRPSSLVIPPLIYPPSPDFAYPTPYRFPSLSSPLTPTNPFEHTLLSPPPTAVPTGPGTPMSYMTLRPFLSMSSQLRSSSAVSVSATIPRILSSEYFESPRYLSPSTTQQPFASSYTSVFIDPATVLTADAYSCGEETYWKSNDGLRISMSEEENGGQGGTLRSDRLPIGSYDLGRKETILVDGYLYVAV